MEGSFAGDEPESGLPVDRDAPVFVVREVEISAPPASVWAVHTDVNRWPFWHPGVAASTLAGELEVGTAIHLRLDGMAVYSRVGEVVPGRLVAWSVQMFGAYGVQRWSLEERGRRTLVRLEESLGGWAPLLMRRTVRRTVERSREAWLEALRDRAEARARDEEGEGGNPSSG